MSLHPRQTKMRIQERDNPGSFLLVHFNPTEWSDAKEVDYEEVEVPGRKTETVQFKMGKPREITMTLFLNEWGQNHRIQKSVEESIEWLRDKQVPKGGSEGGLFGWGAVEPAPPILQLVWREVFTCVLTSVRVTRQKMRPATAAGGSFGGFPRREFDAIRAEVEVTLKEFVESTE